MSANCSNQIFKQPKINTYSPLQLKKSSRVSQMSSSRKKQSQKSFNESPIDPQACHQFYSNAQDDTMREQEHNYFTASFQNMVGTYQTQQEEQNLRMTKGKMIQVQDQDEIEDCSIMDENSTIQQTQDFSQNQKINNSINPRLLHSKNSQNYPQGSMLSSKDFRESLDSSNLQEQKLISQIKQLDEAQELSKSFLSIQKQLQQTFTNSQIEPRPTSMLYDPNESMNSFQKMQGVYNEGQRSTSQIRQGTKSMYDTSKNAKSKTPRFMKPNQIKTAYDEYNDQIMDESTRNIQQPSISTKHRNFDTSKISSSSTNKHSGLLSISQGFFIQQNDKFMGSLNDFVDTKINTLNFMIMEKRRIQQLKEEKITQLNKIQHETSNQLKQQQLHYQEIELNFDKHNGLLTTIEDLKSSILTIRERVTDKQEDYELQNYTLSKQIKDEKQNIHNLQGEIQQWKQQKEKMRDLRQREMNDFKDKIKNQEQRVADAKKKVDLVSINEKNRINYLQEKGCNLMKIIQEDDLYQDKTNWNGQVKKNERTPNHRFKKLDLVDYKQYSSRDRSASSKQNVYGAMNSVRNKKSPLNTKSVERPYTPRQKTTKTTVAESYQGEITIQDQRTQQCISYLSHNQGSVYSSKIQSCDISESSGYDHVIHQERPFKVSQQPQFTNLQQNKPNVSKFNQDMKQKGSKVQGGGQSNQQKQYQKTKEKASIVAKVNLF